MAGRSKPKNGKRSIMKTLEFNDVKGLGNSSDMARATYSSGLLGLARQIAEWHRGRRDYQKLMAMDDHLLKDLGISRSQISAAMNQASPHARARAMARETITEKAPRGIRQAIIASSTEAAKSRELMMGFLVVTRKPR